MQVNEVLQIARGLADRLADKSIEIVSKPQAESVEIHLEARSEKGFLGYCNLWPLLSATEVKPQLREWLTSLAY